MSQLYLYGVIVFTGLGALLVQRWNEDPRLYNASMLLGHAQMKTLICNYVLIIRNAYEYRDEHPHRVWVLFVLLGNAGLEWYLAVTIWRSWTGSALILFYVSFFSGLGIVTILSIQTQCYYAYLRGPTQQK